MSKLTTEEELTTEVRQLLTCISLERLVNATSFTNLVVCVYNILAGSTDAYRMLIELLVELENEFADDDEECVGVELPKGKNLVELWSKAKVLEPEQRMPFDIEQLHAWASSDDPERYNFYASHEKH